MHSAWCGTPCPPPRGGVPPLAVSTTRAGLPYAPQRVEAARTCGCTSCACSLSCGANHGTVARGAEVLVARQHATSVPTSLLRGREEAAGSSLGRLQAACSRRALERVERRVGRASGGKISGRISASAEPGADWRRARCAPRARGLPSRPVASSQAREDCTRIPRWRAIARIVLSRRGRPVSRVGQKKGKSTTCEPSTLRRGAWSRPPRRQRSACTSLPRRARPGRGKRGGK